MLVVRFLLTIMFTQRSSCIVRLQVEKPVGILFKHDNDFSSSCIGKSQPKNTHNKSQHETILTDLNQYGKNIVLLNNFNR